MRQVLLLLACGTLAYASVETMLTAAIGKCLGASTQEQCMRTEVLDYLGRPRSLPGEDEGQMIMRRLKEIAKSNVFRLELPQVFQGASMVFRPDRGLDYSVEFPEESENDVTPRGARDMMKQKMLLPLLMLVKLKLKALTPIMLAMVSLKATKALIMSKIALLLITGFLVFQLCQKLGMAKMNMMPAAMPGTMPAMDASATLPPPMYGPPSPSYGPPTSSYGPPTTASSYEPSAWEPAPGPYARYDTTAKFDGLLQLLCEGWNAGF
ncbi:hypothetical protein GE061_015087 [Apolygus lucorum]|uniref:Osiris 20 n=1 Tax=Apolygus lucorum TaxID=248454 RepID=A0A8S9XJW8_APOLU|nr:hypothetical protein GE061_015087 [Apolygus lucorum]